MYGTIVGRYRLAMTAVLIVYAAVAVDWLARRIAARRWRAAVPAALAALAVGIVSANLLPSVERQQRYRPDEFHMAARFYYDHGDRARAFDELVSGLEKAYAGPDQRTLPPRDESLLAVPFVRVAHELGRDREAAETLERLAAAYPAGCSGTSIAGLNAASQDHRVPPGGHVKLEQTYLWIDDDGTEFTDVCLKVVIECDRDRLPEAIRAVRRVGRGGNPGRATNADCRPPKVQQGFGSPARSRGRAGARSRGIRALSGSTPRTSRAGAARASRFRRRSAPESARTPRA